MPCYHPLHGFKDPYHKHDSGADKYRVTGQREVSSLFYEFDDHGEYQYVTRFSEFSCGYCIGCQLDHAKEWAGRIIAEAATSTSAYFVTFTYADEHLYKVPVKVDDETGEVLEELASVSVRDWQLFMKRLREDQRTKGVENIRFFVGAEYGPKTFRPHYHAIIFNMQLPYPLGSERAILHKLNFNGDPLYRCDYISNLWENGFITIAPVNEKTAGYVVRYTLKKLFRNPISLRRRLSIYRRYLLDDVIPSLSENQLDSLLRSAFSDDLSYYYTRILPESIEEKRRIYLDNEMTLYREKEEFSDKNLYGDFALLEPEFQRSSTAPGLGYQFYMDHMSEILDSGEIWINHVKYPIPRYFNKLAQKHMPDEYAVYQAKREAYAQAKQDLWFAEHPDIDRVDYLKSKEVAHNEHIKILRERSNIK